MPQSPYGASPEESTVGYETNLLNSSSSYVSPHPSRHVIDLNRVPEVNDTSVGAAKLPDAPPSYYASVLPPGWEAKRDEWSRIYYIDHNRGVTQWEPPVAGVADNLSGEHPGFFRRLSSAFAPASAPTYNASGAPGVNSVAFGGYTAYPNPPSADYPPADDGGHAYTYAPYGNTTSNTYAPPYATGAPPTATYASAQPYVNASEAYPLPVPDNVNAFDWSVLTQGQLDDIPPAEFDARNSIKGFGLCGSLFDTIARNTCFFVWSLVMWGVVTAAIVLSIEEANDPDYAHFYTPPPILYVAVMLYFMWTITVTAQVGFLCGCLPVCTCVSSGNGVRDKPLEALRTTTASDTAGLRQYLADLRAGEPVLTLHVQCSHTSSSGSGKRRRTRTVVTYTSQRGVPIARWRDISPSEAVVEQAMHQHAADNICISYECSYRLHPSQAPLIEALRQQYYEENKHRDRTTRAWVSYSVQGHTEDHVDVIAKRNTCRYFFYCLFCNWLTFYVSVWSTLYFLYIVMWKYFQKPVRLVNIKYLHLSDRTMPN